MKLNCPTNIWMMRAVAAMWLRYQQQCYIIALERGAGLCGTPDVIGVTATRMTVEIEIKRTMADFRHNHKKWQARQRRTMFARGQNYDWLPTEPYQFYFLVEALMWRKCRVELPRFAGLMSLPEPNEFHKEYGGISYPIVRVKAPINKHSRRLSVKECCGMAKDQSGTVSSLLNALAARLTTQTPASRQHES